MLTGRCLCGECSYAIEGQPVVVAHCHCRDCQRLSGAGHTTGAMFPRTAADASDRGEAPVRPVENALPPEGGAVRLWTHTHVREDMLALYGTIVNSYSPSVSQFVIIFLFL